MKAKEHEGTDGWSDSDRASETHNQTKNMMIEWQQDERVLGAKSAIAEAKGI